jgi:hypothetical protein
MASTAPAGRKRLKPKPTSQANQPSQPTKPKGKIQMLTDFAVLEPPHLNGSTPAPEPPTIILEPPASQTTAPTPAEPTPSEPAPAERPAMLDKAILIQVDVKRIGNARKVSTECVAADADKDLLHVSKTLLDSQELKAIRTLDGEVKNYLKLKCLPSVLRKGVFLLPLASIGKVNAKMEAFAAQREVLVDAFVAVYPNLIDQAQMRLRELFSEDDYPPAEQVKERFALSWSYVSFGVPESLATIDSALFEEQKQKQAAQWSEAQSVVQDLLRARTLELVSHMTERLTPGADGKAKTFRNSMLENIDEFLGDFDSLNVTSDAELAALVGRARELLSGVDAQTLRKSQNLRESLGSAFGEIQNQLGTLLVDRPRRAVSFEDE